MDSNILQSQKVVKAVVAALVILSVFLLTKTIGEVKRYDDTNYNSITVNGMGEVFAVADIASFSFTVEEKGKTVAEAQRKATSKGDAALKFLRDNGIEEKDIKTTGYNVSPEYNYNTVPCTQFSCPPSTPTLIGYVVSQTVTVKVRNVEKAGEILSGIGATGVSNISGLNFTVDDNEALKAEARSKAIADAKEKAKTLSKDLGVRLGKVMSFYENVEPPVYPMMEARDSVGYGGAAPKAVDLPRGENRVVVNVSVTYRIK